MSAPAPPQKMTSLRCSAPVAPPDTGASTQDAPQLARSLSASTSVASGPMVEKSVSSGAARGACAAPPSPNSTLSTADLSVTHTQTASAPSTASAGLAAGSAPESINRRNFSRLRFQTRILKPARAR